MKAEFLAPGSRAPGGIALDMNETPVELADLYAQGPAFVTFLRHFG